MKISRVAEILNAEILCGDEYLDTELSSAFGADLMSDVLAFVEENKLILTGMVNLHVIRTAEMLDVHCILFVRDKKVPEEILERARDLDMVILRTEKTMYTACGMLYAEGLPGCTRGDCDE